MRLPDIVWTIDGRTLTRERDIYAYFVALALLEHAKRENKSKVVGLIVGASENVQVTMTVHEDGSFTVVEDKVIPYRASRAESRRTARRPRGERPTIRPRATRRAR